MKIFNKSIWLLFRPKRFFLDLKQNNKYWNPFNFMLAISFILYLLWLIRLSLTIKYPFLYFVDFTIYEEIFNWIRLKFLFVSVIFLVTGFILLFILSIITAILCKLVCLFIKIKLKFDIILKIASYSLIIIIPLEVGSIIIKIFNLDLIKFYLLSLFCLYWLYILFTGLLVFSKTKKDK